MRKPLRVAGSMVIGVVMLGAGLSTPASAGLVVWDGGGDGSSWDDPLNWSPDAVPGPADDVVIDVPGRITVVHDAGTDAINSLTCMESLQLSGGSLSIAAASSIAGDYTQSAGSLQGAATLTVEGLLTWTGGNMSGDGVTRANGGLTMGGGTKQILDNRVIENAGMATWTAGSMVNTSTSTFHNLAGASFETQTVATFSGAHFINDGEFIKTTNTGSQTFSGTFENAWTADVQTGTLALNASGAHTGSFSVAAGATLRFDSGTHDLGPTSSVTGDGTIVLDAASVVVDGTFAPSGPTQLSSGNVIFNVGTTLPTFTQSGGSLQGAATLTVQGPLTWTGGNMRGDGVTRADGGLMLSGSTKQMLDNRVIENAGIATWTAGGMVNTSTSTFHNLAGASFETQIDAAFSGAHFINDGEFIRTTSTGSQSFSLTFDNAWTVDVQTGTLALNASGVHSGAFTVAADATLRFDSGTHDLGPTSSVTGDGTIVLDAASVVVDGTFAPSGPTQFSSGNVIFNVDTTLPTFTQFGGSLQGAATLTVQGLLTWTGGNMRGDGVTRADGGLMLSGALKQIVDNRVIENAGMATWTAGNMTNTTTSTFHNLAGATFETQTDATFSGAHFINDGEFIKTTNTGSQNFSGPFDTTGTVEVLTGILNVSNDYTQTDGLTNIAAGAELQVSGAADFQGGGLIGNGLVDANVTSAATVAPGSSAGQLTIEGNYTQADLLTNPGTLNIEIGGTVPIVEHDVLAVVGNAVLDGFLVIVPIGGFDPALRQQFTILTATGTVTGQFELVECPLYEITYEPQAVIATVVQEVILGDVNCDGVVNVLDFLALLAVWGLCPDPPEVCPADLDGDGAVGIVDFLILLSAWT